MKASSAKFLTSAQTIAQCPQSDLPQVAFAGRSNVGKSSLINSLTGRKGLVKVSKTPGKTRLLNFFDISGELLLVDMPGYGFANVPKTEKQKWGKMVEIYLQESENLKAVICLLDCRRAPNDDDRNLLGWLHHYDIPAIIVFTKIDKIPKTKRIKQFKLAMAEIEDLLAPENKPLVYSSLSGEGKRELWGAIKSSIVEP
ncbi:GTP-binding protein EngB [hydrothermal vent metagenome]|uniref:GTP-binding protein EngB n=1 Tax=hydrothermal vent metagenome TaxID=652676 RepID=A0A3B1CPG2_9ZZZZ